MKRTLPFLFLLVAGCSPPDATSPPPSTPSQLKPVEVDLNKLDFRKWPSATKDPIRVDPRVFAPCAAAQTPEQAKETEAKMKHHGPHFKPSIVVRVNPEAIEAFKAGKERLPAGAVIIKEKHSESLTLGPPAEVGIMIKREAGYDPSNGDWEYAFIKNDLKKEVTRGKLENCMKCHATQSANDYLFRSYLAKGK